MGYSPPSYARYFGNEFVGVSTIQRWYYAARAEKIDPVGVLRRKIRKDAGQQPSLNEDICRILEAQYSTHKRWSYQLHFDNLGLLVEENPHYGAMSSDSSVLRYMKSHDLIRRSLPVGKMTPGLQKAEAREVRS